jgi:hypothetical protein
VTRGGVQDAASRGRAQLAVGRRTHARKAAGSVGGVCAHAAASVHVWRLGRVGRGTRRSECGDKTGEAAAVTAVVVTVRERKL